MTAVAKRLTDERPRLLVATETDAGLGHVQPFADRGLRGAQLLMQLDAPPVVVDCRAVVLVVALGIAAEMEDDAEVVVGPGLLGEVAAVLGESELPLHEALARVEVTMLDAHHGRRRQRSAGLADVAELLGQSEGRWAWSSASARRAALPSNHASAISKRIRITGPASSASGSASFEQRQLELELAALCGHPAQEASDVDALRRCRGDERARPRTASAVPMSSMPSEASPSTRSASQGASDAGPIPEVDGGPERSRRGAGCADGEERLTGVPQMIGGPAGLTSGPQVAGDHLAVLDHPLARRRFEPRRGESVERRTLAEQHGLVRHVTDQRVLEEVLAGVLERRVITPEHELTANVRRRVRPA